MQMKESDNVRTYSVPSSLKNKYCKRLATLKGVKRNDLHTSVCVIAQICKL